MRRPLSDDKTLLAQTVYDALKERIMDQAYPPGERLNIDALAAALKVSPTPVREALARLSAEHLITFEAYKGYRVSPLLTTEQVVDLMHVRRLIEVDAARLAAPRVRTPDLLLLERILRESAQTEPGTWSHGYKQFNHLDQRFHETLIGLAGNRFLVGAFRSLYVHVELGRFYHVFSMVDHRETCSEHEAIFHALGRRDPDLAAEAVEAHLKATEVRIFHLVDELAHAPTTLARTA